MLIPIKHFTVDGRIPTRADLEEAKQICIKEDCEIDLHWLPNSYAGWYHVYIEKDSDLDYIEQYQVPKVYGV